MPLKRPFFAFVGKPRDQKPSIDCLVWSRTFRVGYTGLLER